MSEKAKTPVSARDRLLEAAARLFYANGMGATGIDAITTAAGVAKKSLYNNFSSKDDLITSYIEARHREWLDLYAARMEQTQCPRDAVLAVFDAYIDHASLGYEHGFRGCGLLNAAAELPAGDPGRTIVRRHKEYVESILEAHLAALYPAPNAGDMAEHLAYLLEGAITRAGLDGNPGRILQAKTIAEHLINER